MPLTSEKTIGISNFLSIAWLQRGLELAAPVGRVVIGDEKGTGFLLANDLLITNNHVLPDSATVERAVLEFNYQLNWNGQFEPVTRYNFAQLERTSAELDYSLVRIAGSPGDLFGYIDPVNRGPIAVNDYVVIVQHPQGGPKQIALTDNKVSAVFNNLVQYTTDTESGSSGSPVFDQNWRIVALHHFGGNLPGPDNKRYFINEGIQFATIVRDAADILHVSDLVYAISFGDLRSDLAKIILNGFGEDAGLFAAQLLHTRPSFGVAISDRLAMRPAGESESLAGAASGVAIGAALMQWARTDGHGAISTPTTVAPEPSPELVDAMRELKSVSKLPATVYAEVLALIENKPALVERLMSSLPNAPNVAAACKSFISGVPHGAQAYGRAEKAHG